MVPLTLESMRCPRTPENAANAATADDVSRIAPVWVELFEQLIG